MKQYVFFHTDINGCLWKHVHMTYVQAVKHRKWWAEMKLTTACSRKIHEEAKTESSPVIIGRTLQSRIPVEDYTHGETNQPGRAKQAGEIQL